MTGPRLKVAVIIGSTRAGRVAPTVSAWFVRHAAARDDMGVDVIDLADIHLPDVLGSDGGQPARDLAARLADADAFVVVTPEYNRSFPAPLKNVIDWNGEPWRAKPVGFVSYGGASGGLRAVEQLRLVFTELHAVTVRDSVSFHGIWAAFDTAGEPTDTVRSGKAATKMLDQIAWWGATLREGRLKRPYVIM
jgi:NAD(P)H-dependent FMN reductase